ncbi:MAG TPA: dihydrolipoamide acetyltransferase family protein [Ureibacillus sp.]|nr:dihydrolipoamide acetyltransferase family protein [Ureibacillus sp.]
MATTEIILPKMSLNMEEGTIVSWLAEKGTSVKRGDILLEVQTDKAVSEVEANTDGYLGEIIVHDGETVPVGTVIGMIIDQVDEKIEITNQDNQLDKPKKQINNQLQPTESIMEKRSKKESLIRISPAARKLSIANQIDLQSITASGPFGRIVLRDVYRKLEEEENQIDLSLSTLGKLSRVTGIRKAIATNLTNSTMMIPQFTISKYIQVEYIEEYRKKMNLLSSGSIKISMNDFLIKAIAQSIDNHPIFNNYYIVKEDAHYIQENTDINIGLAVATNQGLFVPVIKNVANKSLIDIAKERLEIIKKAQNGQLSMEEMNGATFTISSLGTLNVDHFTAIINPPESGIIAVGKIDDSLYLDQGQVKVKKRMNVTASFDHRLIDGADGAMFMNTLETILEENKWHLF